MCLCILDQLTRSGILLVQISSGEPVAPTISWDRTSSPRWSDGSTRPCYVPIFIFSANSRSRADCHASPLKKCGSEEFFKHAQWSAQSPNQFLNQEDPTTAVNPARVQLKATLNDFIWMLPRMIFQGFCQSLLTLVLYRATRELTVGAIRAEK